MEVGADGIVVSNHGGRQLDYTPATITVLEEIVCADQGRIPVLLDGGVRRELTCSGAQAVMIGGPVIFGLAAMGQREVRSVIAVLRNELELAMALAGCCTVKDITRNHVMTERDRPSSRM